MSIKNGEERTKCRLYDAASKWEETKLPPFTQSIPRMYICDSGEERVHFHMRSEGVFEQRKKIHHFLRLKAYRSHLCEYTCQYDRHFSLFPNKLETARWAGSGDVQRGHDSCVLCWIGKSTLHTYGVVFRRRLLLATYRGSNIRDFTIAAQRHWHWHPLPSSCENSEDIFTSINSLSNQDGFDYPSATHSLLGVFWCHRALVTSLQFLDLHGT